MSEHAHPEIRILQQNCRASKTVSLSLISEANPANFDLILIQEPYIYPNTRLSIASPKWRSYYPDQSPSDTNSPRSLLLVNAQINPATIKQIPLCSSHVTSITLHTAPHQLQIFNIYNPPNTDLAFTDLNAWLRNAPHCHHTIWAGDFNKHHPMWSGYNVPDCCQRSDTDTMLQLLLHCNLSLRLPPNTPTYQLDAHDTWSTLDLVFSTQDVAHAITKCQVLPDSCIPGADHLPVLTTVNTVLPTIPPVTRLNYKDITGPNNQTPLPLMSHPSNSMFTCNQQRPRN